MSNHVLSLEVDYRHSWRQHRLVSSITYLYSLWYLDVEYYLSQLWNQTNFHIVHIDYVLFLSLLIKHIKSFPFVFVVIPYLLTIMSVCAISFTQ